MRVRVARTHHCATILEDLNVVDRGSAAQLLVLVRLFFNDTATTEIYTLSLHDALPICNAYHFGNTRHVEGYVNRGRLAHGQRDPGLHMFGKARILHGQFVVPRRKIWNDKKARSVGSGRVSPICVDLAQADGGTDDRSAACVLDRPVELSEANRGLPESVRR